MLHTADQGIVYRISLLSQQIRQFAQRHRPSQCFFMNRAGFTNPQRLINKGQIPTDIVLSQMPHETFQPSRPWLKQYMETIKTFILSFGKQFPQNFITGIPPVTENIGRAR
ncbi:hypothetical protein EN46_18385 [Citrobacter amalonaticus]